MNCPVLLLWPFFLFWVAYHASSGVCNQIVVQTIGEDNKPFAKRFLCIANLLSPVGVTYEQDGMSGVKATHGIKGSNTSTPLCAKTKLVHRMTGMLVTQKYKNSVAAFSKAISDLQTQRDNNGMSIEQINILIDLAFKEEVELYLELETRTCIH